MAWVSTLRHKTAPRICLDESFLLLFLYLNPYLLPAAPWHVWKLGVRGKVCPPAQEFGKRGGVFRILMPTAPTRIKLSPALLVSASASLADRALDDPKSYPRHKTAPRICMVEIFLLLFLSLLSLLSQAAPLFGDVLTLPVQLRPPERGIVVVIGVFCRYWEGDFVSGGWKCCPGERGCLVICLEVVGAGESLSSCPRIFENVAAFSEFLCPPHLLESNFPPAFPVITPTYLASEALMFRNPAFGIKLRPASAWMKLSSCFYCHYFRVFTCRASFLVTF